MGDKRDFNAFCGAADITLCGLPHAEGAKYVPPAAEVTVFALEKGFAISNEVKTQGAPGGNQKYGKETWGTNTYNSSTGTWSGNGWGDETDW